MKTIAFMFIISLAAAWPLHADKLVLTDGTETDVIVVKEDESSVTVNWRGAEIQIPRKKVKSITKASPEQKAEVVDDWKGMNERYKEQSRRSEEADLRRALLSPDPTAAPPPPPVREKERPPVQEKVVFPARPPAAGRKAAAQPQPRTKTQERLDRHTAVRKAVSKKEVVPGMTEKEVRAAWGFPSSTAPVNNVRVSANRWTYRRPDGVMYVYFRDGVVTSITR